MGVDHRGPDAGPQTAIRIRPLAVAGWCRARTHHRDSNLGGGDRNCRAWSDPPAGAGRQSAPDPGGAWLAVRVRDGRNAPGCLPLRDGLDTGSRPLHIEHVGWDLLVPGPRQLADEVGVELGAENTVWVNLRVEIALNGETFEVLPDGPSVKLYTRGGPVLALGIDPIAAPVRPYAVTVPEKFWWGSEGPLLDRPQAPSSTKLKRSATLSGWQRRRMPMR